MSESPKSLLAQLDSLDERPLRRLLTEHLNRKKPGLYREANAVEHDRALNANRVFPLNNALRAAIDAGNAPKSGKTPLLRRDLPDLEFCPFKRYKERP